MSADDEAEAPKAKNKRLRTTDPVLQAASRLDRLLSALPAEHSHWVLRYLWIKYARGPTPDAAREDF